MKEQLKKRLRNKIAVIVENILKEDANNKLGYIAQKVSALGTELQDYNFDIRDKKDKVIKMWEEVRVLLNHYDPNRVISNVRYKGEEE